MLVQACLEGRHDQAGDTIVTSKLGDIMEATMLRDFGKECLEKIKAVLDDTTLSSTEVGENTEVLRSSMVCLHMVFTDLELIPEYKEQLKYLGTDGTGDDYKSYREQVTLWCLDFRGSEPEP